MKARGILFKGEMIRALLNVQPNVWPAQPIDANKPWKWQTRRTMKPQPSAIPKETDRVPDSIDPNLWWPSNKAQSMVGMQDCTACGPIEKREILYAKETFIPKQSGTIFHADVDPIEAAGLGGMYGGWKPSIFLPKALARLWFEVVRVRVERVNKISEADAQAEGVDYFESHQGTECYRKLWNTINGAGDFEKGPWVWVYDLKRISKPEGIK